MPTPPHIYTSPMRFSAGDLVYWTPAAYFYHSVAERRQKEVYKEKEYKIDKDKHQPPFLCTIIGNTEDRKARTIWKVEHCGLVFTVPYWELSKVSDSV